MRRILESKLISPDALKRLIENLEKNTAEVVRNAIQITKSDKTKIIITKDLRKIIR